MKFLFFIIISLLSTVNFSYSYDKPWNCLKITEQKSKCINQVGKNNLQYTGEVKNNAPNGYGVLKVLNDDMTAEGVWKTEVGEYKPIQISGTRNLWGTKVFLRNEELYKINYPNGSIFEGSRSKVMNSGKRAKEINGTLRYSNKNIFKGTMKNILNPKPLKGTFYYALGDQKGDTFTGTFHEDSKLIYPKEGKYIFSKNNKWLYYEGSSDINGKYIYGELKFKNGDRYVGSFKNQNYHNGTYYYANGDIYKYVNSSGKSEKKTTSKNKKVKKYKSRSSSDGNFLTSFILSWVFTGLLWIIIIFYFRVIGSIGTITKKIDKKIPGTQNVAFFTGFAVTWYLAWALLVGFEPALLINFVLIYLGVWASITVFILNIITKSMKGKAEIYISLFLGACSLGLAVEMIGPFIKFLKNL